MEAIEPGSATSPYDLSTNIASHTKNAKESHKDIDIPAPRGDDYKDPPYECVDPSNLPLPRALPLPDDSYKENKDSSSVPPNLTTPESIPMGTTDVEDEYDALPNLPDPFEYDDIYDDLTEDLPIPTGKTSSPALKIPQNTPEDRQTEIEQIYETIGKMLGKSVSASTPVSPETAVPHSVSQETADPHISPEYRQKMEVAFETIGMMLGKSVSASTPVTPKTTIPPSVSQQIAESQLSINSQQPTILADMSNPIIFDEEYIDIGEIVQETNPSLSTSTELPVTSTLSSGNTRSTTQSQITARKSPDSVTLSSKTSSPDVSAGQPTSSPQDLASLSLSCTISETEQGLASKSSLSKPPILPRIAEEASSLLNSSQSLAVTKFPEYEHLPDGLADNMPQSSVTISAYENIYEEVAEHRSAEAHQSIHNTRANR